MKFVRAKDADAKALCTFWNRFAEVEIPHKKLSEQAFFALWMEDSGEVKKRTFLALEDDEIIGFANGCHRSGKAIAYITFVCVAPEHRRKRIGARLLMLLENALTECADTVLTGFEVTFFNPINLEWCIPNTPRHDHPNAPGVDMKSDGYIFLKNLGYRDIVYQNSYYQPLAAFAFSDVIKEKMAWQKDNNLGICYYDPQKHYGMEELMENLGSEDWSNQILGNLAKEQPYPVLIAYSSRKEDLDEQGRAKAVGFTGPLYAQESGRGYFAGIGVHSEYRKYGLGKVLFSGLCSSLKELGAQYMTLFTGENNPARNIYESAGFKIVRSWSDMRRLLTQHDQRCRTEVKKIIEQ